MPRKPWQTMNLPFGHCVAVRIANLKEYLYIFQRLLIPSIHIQCILWQSDFRDWALPGVPAEYWYSSIWFNAMGWLGAVRSSPSIHTRGCSLTVRLHLFCDTQSSEFYRFPEKRGGILTIFSITEKNMPGLHPVCARPVVWRDCHATWLFTYLITPPS